MMLEHQYLGHNRALSLTRGQASLLESSGNADDSLLQAHTNFLAMSSVCISGTDPLVPPLKALLVASRQLVTSAPIFSEQPRLFSALLPHRTAAAC